MRGSIKWCCQAPARSQRRFATLLVASAAAQYADRAAAGKRDVHRPARGEVSAGRDVAVAADQRQSVVDRLPLDDAVEVEQQAVRPVEEEPVHAD